MIAIKVIYFYHSVMTTTMEIGSLNEKGILNSWYKQGFNTNKCIMELIANSIDANATDIRISCDSPDELYITDNGNGMDENDFRKFACLHAENHKNEIKCGVGGIGAKPSLLILSKKKLLKFIRAIAIKMNGFILFLIGKKYLRMENILAILF